MWLQLNSSCLDPHGPMFHDGLFPDALICLGVRNYCNSTSLYCMDDWFLKSKVSLSL